ncbi:Sad1/UNC domain protein [Aspergillus homomorphus CBS 101889]|uniref:SUN domain-containing protein n=1 Tax=Aspergillus homomorphus (strain CBS 101889) TaxID=1450537 RepID=A0A395HRD5_ASPHC|nr:hypothetical protein BO97DRAFT_394876 [Aspergillus homomorphus CBS 101889]RAL10039.1 hypothetical protein BO97DRAFT_394876 [Aspergillus homomorphus CBS 101889]
MTGWTATQWIPWMTLISTWIDGTGANQSPSVCLARDGFDLGAELIQWPACVETRWGHHRPEVDAATYISHTSSAAAASAGATSVTVSAIPTSTEEQQQQRTDQELDTESPLDNAKFLSFEDWKKQNLAKVGQSAENVGGNRRGGVAGNKEDRRRPTGINNALDSLGDDAEIELDFGGFGADTAPEATKPTAWGAAMVSPSTEAKSEGMSGAGVEGAGAEDGRAQSVPQTGVSRSKDAGTTCKERFNYASFDCAATVLKTNPECTGSSSVLIENKDSYMLNECRAKNKFLVLELCDDILVDTVVLANYEFFSSIFHTVRVSVADRYPAKLDQWRELGVYEARNTREVQAFAVENPLIWARYLKIEFLTHYGNEFFCPLSLIRVHGTTMLEEYKHDGETAPVDDEISEESLEPAPPAPDLETTTTVVESSKPVVTESADTASTSDAKDEACHQSGSDVDVPELRELLGLLDTCDEQEAPATSAGPDVAAQPPSYRPVSNETSPSQGQESPASGKDKEASSREPGEPKASSVIGTMATDSPSSSTTAANSETVSPSPVTEADSKTAVPQKDEPSSVAEPTRSSMTQPPSSNPTTQESFFKSVHKRLQMLESNSSLSLQYIEEQSRILRDAFNKVEKRQLAKTSTFLEGLNVTVLNELKQFREQYDQVWKSVALEFEHQRIQYHQEIHSLSSQLGVLADELVFQKRVAVIQSMMILFCFGLVLFARGTANGYIEIPRVQNMVTRSYSLRSSSSPSPPYGSPLVSPTSTRPASSGRRTGGHRRNVSEDSQDELLSPTLAYSPPTPVSVAMSSAEDEGSERRGEDRLDLPEVPPVQRSRSSPPDLPREEGTSGSETSPVDNAVDSLER